MRYSLWSTCEKDKHSVFRLSWSSSIDRDHSDSEVLVRIRMVNGVVQHGSVPFTDIVSFSPLVVLRDGDIVAQDGYPLQSEGRTPGDEDSSGVDGDHGEVTYWF